MPRVLRKLDDLFQSGLVLCQPPIASFEIDLREAMHNTNNINTKVARDSEAGGGSQVLAQTQRLDGSLVEMKRFGNGKGMGGLPPSDFKHTAFP